MAKTAAQRQAEYRARRAQASENGSKRICTWVSTSTTEALRKLSKRDGVTQSEVIERLVKAEDDAEGKKLAAGTQKSHAISQRRIYELEHALQDVIEYLHKLPLNPETKRVADETQHVLDNDKNLSILAASAHTSAGIQLIDAKVKGNTLILQTIPDKDGRIAIKQKDELHRLLLDGLELNFREV